MPEPKPIPKLFVGMKVFQLTILEIIPGSYPKGKKKDYAGHKHRRVRCLCDCGIESIKYYDSIRWHKTKSCGHQSKINGLTHGLHKSSEYGTWDGMKRRCYNKAGKDYKRYGGRGITMCERWKNSFESFFEDMGFKPTPKHTLDRINNDGNYEKSNCKWATPKEQAQNRRNSPRVKLNEETVLKIRKEWPALTQRKLAEKYNVSHSNIAGIINRKTWKNI